MGYVMRSRIMLCAPFMLLLMLSANTVSAKQVMSLALGKAKLDEVRAQLNNSSASFEDDFSYRNSGDKLRIYKVHDFVGFAKYGDVREAWLFFTPDKTLYKISVTWEDPEDHVSRLLLEILDTKYGMTKRFGKDYGIQYLDITSDTSIKLWLNRRCGREQTTTLVYIYNPLISSVVKTKLSIDEALHKEKAESITLPSDL